ncbi:hypothetical protein JR316_0005409 [Psilocybe cubensis]|uniref:Uncharacterized protein n=2 Tax=Psilocybe cubensis TaxID=181762 RepID=A0ACB8H5M9_PSICU|nr:hypothetical protein JR316_0005409 [Psilocybe cubensis]KAH9483303.1 hypothetical protein JR316_0005409 [Psilocybe cubensis]
MFESTQSDCGEVQDFEVGALRVDVGVVGKNSGDRNAQLKTDIEAVVTVRDDDEVRAVLANEPKAERLVKQEKVSLTFETDFQRNMYFSRN